MGLVREQRVTPAKGDRHRRILARASDRNESGRSAVHGHLGVLSHAPGVIGLHEVYPSQTLAQGFFNRNVERVFSGYVTKAPIAPDQRGVGCFLNDFGPGRRDDIALAN